VDPDLTPRRLHYRAIMQAVHDGLEAVPYVYALDDPSDVLPSIVPLRGCRAGRTHGFPDRGVVATEILLGRPLAVDETTVVEVLIELPPAVSTEHGQQHFVAHRVRELLLWARFHPDAVPERVEGFVELQDGTRDAWPVPPDGLGYAHTTVRSFGPGLVGLRWDV